MVSLDLLEIGIDVWDRDLMRSRPGVWLRSALTGLISRPPVAYREEPIPGDDKHIRLVPIWGTRVQKRWPQVATQQQVQ